MGGGGGDTQVHTTFYLIVQPLSIRPVRVASYATSPYKVIQHLRRLYPILSGASRLSATRLKASGVLTSLMRAGNESNIRCHPPGQADKN